MSFINVPFTHKMMTDGGLDYARSVLEKHLEKPQPEISWKVSKTLSPSHLTFSQRRSQIPSCPAPA